MKKLVSIFMAGFLMLCVFAQENQTARNRYALVIGNQNYKDNPLSRNIADAEKIKKSLENKMFDVTYKTDLDSTELEKVINTYIEKVNSDLHGVSLVYYSGYAFTDSSKNYLLPVDNNKYHSKEEAVKYGIDLQSQLADKIKTNAQIYIIDGAYENPFRAEGTRAIGIKGGLSKAKSERESIVGFLFSAGEGQTVVPSSALTRTSNFADAVSAQIETSNANLDSVFNTIKANVSAKTNNEQIPYSSTTTMQFAFNGEELIALQKRAAEADADRTSIERAKMGQAFAETTAATTAMMLESSAQAEAQKAALAATLAAKRAAQEEEDRARKAMEEERALQRSAADNAKIAAYRDDFAAIAESMKANLKKDSSAEDRIDYIETNKSSLKVLRNEIAAQIASFEADTNADTDEKVAEVWARELKTVEKDKDGNMTKDAENRRKDEEKNLRKEGAQKKNAKRAEKKVESDQNDKKFLPLIKTGYTKLESGLYSVSSLEDNVLTVRIDDYDGDDAGWNLHITSELFGYTTLFEDDILLSYTDVTGIKNTKVSTMTDAQLKDYNDNVELYDALFRGQAQVFYVKLSYKLMRWKDASEYHFIPQKLEVIRLEKKKNGKIKEIKTCSKLANEMNSADFIVYPQVEIRTNGEIKSDKARADKTIAKEIQAKPVSEETTAAPAASSTSSSSSLFDYQPSQSNSTPANSGKAKKDDDFKLKGRNGFYVTGNLLLSDLFQMNLYKDAFKEYERNPYAIEGEIHLSLSPISIFYFDFGVGAQKWNYDEKLYNMADDKLKEKLDKVTITGSFSGGLTVCIANTVRPYIGGGISYTDGAYNFKLGDTDNVIGLHAGAGVDLCFAKYFMLTVGWRYGWMHYLDSFKNGVIDETKETAKNAWDTGTVEKPDYKTSIIDVLKNPDYHQHEIFVGLGFTW